MIIQAEWSVCVISILWIYRISCGQMSNFRSIDYIDKHACEKQCTCYSWKSSNATQEYDRFFVNCTGTRHQENTTTGMEYGFSRNEKYIPPLPINTTDLLVTGYFLDTLNINSFNHTPFREPLLNMVFRYISSATLIRGSRKSLHNADLNSTNMTTQSNTDLYFFLRKLTTISVPNNQIYKVERGSFRKVHQVKLINISHNWLKEIEPGTFYEVSSLVVLDVSYNKLNNLPWMNISQLLSLKVLRLRGNFWNCSCKMRDILKLKRSLLIGTQAVCHFPPRLNGTLLEYLNSDTFSHCFTTEQPSQYSKASAIITMLSLLILSCLYIYSCVYSNKQSKKPSQTHSEAPYISDAAPCMRIGKIWYNINDHLDKYGMVYKGGLTDGREAAIKKHLKINVCKEFKCKKCKELKFFLHMSKAGPHPNIIRYLWLEHDKDFTYFALDLCAGNLMTAITECVDGFDNIVDPQNYFLQLASGISFLHENGIEHRDIKPQNILWKRTVSGIALVISDFDLSHLSKEKSSNNICGTKGWSAPELWQQETRSTDVDIFSLGCVFYFILTRGHPFGAISDLEESHKNIMSPEYKATLAELYKHHNEQLASLAEDLIHRMICSKTADRIKACKIKEHPLFWTTMEMKDFLTKIGNYVKDKDDQNVISFKEMLEEDASTVFDGSWLDKLHPTAKSDLKSCRKDKQDYLICGLLYSIRNKIQHFEGIRKMELREIYLGSSDGVVEYYTRLFPRLVSYKYRVLGKSKLKL